MGSDTRDPLAEVVHRLSSLAAPALTRLSRGFAADVFEAGLRVRRDDRFVAIPPLLTPVPPVAEAGAAAKLLLDGVIAVARSIFTREPAALSTWPLFAGLTPLEKECIAAGWKDAERVASARVDFLRDEGGKLFALEVNTTIPAMQAYSDVVAREWVRHAGPAIGAPPEAVARALAMLPSNVDELRRSLLAQGAETGAGKAGRWALLARANDSQDGELEAIAEQWRAAGLDPVRVTPDDVLSRGPFDLIYRHLFARRIAPGHPLEEVFRNPRRFAMWNPVNGHLEIKGLVALLSEASSTDTVHTPSIAPDLLDAARKYVPWTRILSRGEETTLPAGERTRDLASWVSAHAGEIVLKRSWDYGGRSVFLSDDFSDGDAKTREKLLEATGRAIGSWKEMVEFAIADEKGPWIAQWRARPRREKHLRVVDGEARWEELVTDVSAFSGSGAAFHPSGQTARAASGPVVNIVAGGGMAPIIPVGALRALLGI